MIAGYVVDFYCASAELAIEIDGDVHLVAMEYDAIRDRALAEMGIRTIRIRDQDVDEDLDEVLKTIADETSPLAPLPSGEGNQHKKKSEP